MTIGKGSYRSIYSAIWDNPKFQQLDAITKLVFLHLRTCPECNWPCIFPFYKSTLYERFTDVDSTTIDRSWDILRADLGNGEPPWVIYERPLLWIVKGLENDPTFTKGNSNNKAGVLSLLRTLPKMEIVNKFAVFYEISYHEDPSLPPILPPSLPPILPPIRGEQGKGKGKGKGEGEGRIGKEGSRSVERFSPPSLEDVIAYCKARENNVDPIKFHAHYVTNGWMAGKVPMKNWKSAVVKWERGYV